MEFLKRIYKCWLLKSRSWEYKPSDNTAIMLDEKINKDGKIKKLMLFFKIRF